ncbi:MAG: cytochrome C oxidase Cbb3, partial [Deltaproteobacteria bacterium]
RRMGPDLARIGGKYPDAWHYKHMHDPRSMVPQTNMPAYAFLEENKVDPEETRHKMDVLGFPYSEADIKNLAGKSEMDAIVAYLQKLGTGIDWRKQNETTVVGDLANPFPGDKSAIEAGEKLYGKHCAACHGENRQGDIGPDLTGLAGMEDADLFQILYNGIPDGGMPSFSKLGATKNWQLVNYLLHED